MSCDGDLLKPEGPVRKLALKKVDERKQSNF